MSTMRQRSWPRRLSLLLIASTVALGTPLAGGAGHALADSGCGDGTASSSGPTVTCTFSFTGSEQQFPVPSGVTSVNVVAIGADGGGGATAAGLEGGPPPGAGAEVKATISGLTSGATLYVEVGGGGASGGVPTGGGGIGIAVASGSTGPLPSYMLAVGAGGFGGGGTGANNRVGGGNGTGGGGGGGASDVRSCSMTVTSCADGSASSPASRLIVAGGGGGGGSNAGFSGSATGGFGGDAGVGGRGGAPDGSIPGGGGGGSGGQGAGGAGGAGGGSGEFAGVAGSGGGFGGGGGGGSFGSGGGFGGGGGGGGGFFGGGGGGGGAGSSPLHGGFGGGSGGGGGGSDFVETGATSVTMGIDTIGVPMVVISYTLQQSTTMSLSSSSAIYEGTTTLQAILTAGGIGVSGKTITFTLNGNSFPNNTAVTDSNGVATLSNVSLAGINAGSYPIGVGAAFAGDPSYAGSSGTGTLTISQAAATATLGNLNQTYDGTAKTVTVTTSPSGLNVTVTYNGSSTAPINAGSYPVVATVNDPNYQGSASGTLVIAPAAQAITFGSLPGHAAGDPPFTVSATGGASGNPVTFTIDSGTPATVCTATGPNGATITIVGPGTCTVDANQAGNGNYSPAPQVTQSFTIMDTDLVLTNLPANLTTDATSPAGTVVTYTLPMAVDEAGDSPAPTVACTPASGSTFPIGITTVTCTATDSDDTNGPVGASFTVTVKGAAAQIGDLINLVDSFGLSHGPRNSLDVKLEHALAAVQGGATAEACGDLTAFGNEVRAQSGKKLTTAQANQALAAASNIMTVLGC